MHLIFNMLKAVIMALKLHCVCINLDSIFVETKILHTFIIDFNQIFK